jgi:hypothetical protein
VNHLENTKSVSSIVATGSSAAAGTVALTVDTIGYEYLSMDAVYSTCVVTSAVASIFTLRAGDTVASLADYTSTYGSVSAVTSVANTSAAQTSQPTVVRLDFDLRGKPRYVSVATAPSDTAARAILVARLGKAADGPDTAAEKGTRLKFSN